MNRKQAIDLWKFAWGCCDRFSDAARELGIPKWLASRIDISKAAAFLRSWADALEGKEQK